VIEREIDRPGTPWNLIITSAPHRDLLACEIWFGKVIVAELFSENGLYQIELYGEKPNWPVVPAGAFAKVILEAEAELAAWHRGGRGSKFSAIIDP
jgi:hypothetical protein